MTLDEAIDRMMTCATAHVCQREEACFEVVKWAKEQRDTEMNRAALIRALNEVRSVDEVEYYAPHFPPQVAWEWGRAMAVDWDAA